MLEDSSPALTAESFADEEGVEGGAVGWLGGGRLRRVLGGDPESGLIMGGDRELRGKLPLACGACAAADGGPPTVMAGSVCGPPGTDVRSRRPGGRSGVGCQILLRWRCDRPWLDAAGSLREVSDAVLVAWG